MGNKIIYFSIFIVMVIFEPSVSYAFLPPSLPGNSVMDQIRMNRQRKQQPKQVFQSRDTKSGIVVIVPADWSKERDDENNLNYMGPMSHSVSISFVKSHYQSDFPVETSLSAYMQSSKKEKEKGTIIHFEEKIFGGVKGVLRIESPANNPDDLRRITWIGYKDNAGINIVASSQSRYFDDYQRDLLNILDTIAFNW